MNGDDDGEYVATLPQRQHDAGTSAQVRHPFKITRGLTTGVPPGHQMLLGMPLPELRRWVQSHGGSLKREEQP